MNDLAVLGRVTYQLFVNYWPFATGADAERMNHLPKLICSRTLSNVEWNNSRLAGRDVVEEITRLKQKPGQDIALFGTANLATALARHGLIDEYRIFVSPVILGRGNPMFKDLWGRMRLKLLKASMSRVLLFSLPIPVLTWHLTLSE